MAYSGFDNIDSYCGGEGSPYAAGASDGNPVQPISQEDHYLSPLIDTKYVQELNVEKQTLDHETYPHAIRLVSQEINRVTLGRDKLIDLHNDKPTKVSVKVRVPVVEYPKFNFIGKIIGPKGNTLRRLQEETGCRMAVFGRGSMRDKEKEEELRLQGGKYAHLNEELHVYIEAYGHPIDVHRRLSFALGALRRHLVPDYNDDITQGQVQELAYLNGGTIPLGRGGRGPGRSVDQPGPFMVPGGMMTSPRQSFALRPTFNQMTLLRGSNMAVPARGSGRGATGVSRGGAYTTSVPIRRGTTNFTRPVMAAPMPTVTGFSPDFQHSTVTPYDYGVSQNPSQVYDVSFNGSSPAPFSHMAR